jgi:hypothetical protein
MACPSSLTRAGIPCLGFFGAASDSPSASDLESDTLEDLDGVGSIGAMTGMAVVHSLTITPSFHTAGTSATTGFITVISAMAVSITPADSMGLRVFTAAPPFMEVPAFPRSQECTLAHSAVLLTAEMSEAFRPAEGQASEAASMEAGFRAVVFMVVAAGVIKNSRNGEEYHVAQDFDFCSI